MEMFAQAKRRSTQQPRIGLKLAPSLSRTGRGFGQGARLDCHCRRVGRDEIPEAPCSCASCKATRLPDLPRRSGLSSPQALKRVKISCKDHATESGSSPRSSQEVSSQRLDLTGNESSPLTNLQTNACAAQRETALVDREDRIRLVEAASRGRRMRAKQLFSECHSSERVAFVLDAPYSLIGERIAAGMGRGIGQ
jgi:hypothetical protein